MHKSGLMKVLAVSAVICFAECAAGSCLNYGHACWGAHGKRSGAHIRDPERISEPSWFLSKLVNSPSEIRYAFEGNNELKENADLFRAMDSEKTRLSDWNQPSDELFDDYNARIGDSNKLRYNILEKSTANHN